MTKIYDDNELARSGTLLRRLGVAKQAAVRVRDRVAKAAQPNANQFLVQFSEDGLKHPLDFRLSTECGNVYAKFDFARKTDAPIGKYVFYIENSPLPGSIEYKKIFTLLIHPSGMYKFGESLITNAPNDGFVQDMDFFDYYLLGNIALRMFEEIEEVQLVTDIGSIV